MTKNLGFLDSETCIINFVHTCYTSLVVVVVKFFNKNFVRRKVDNANIQTETDIKQSKQVQLHSTNIQNSDTAIKTKQAKFSPGDIGINIYISLYNFRLTKFFRMYSDGITERVRPCPQERRL